jgi:hypothetical protein
MSSTKLTAFKPTREIDLSHLVPPQPKVYAICRPVCVIVDGKVEMRHGNFTDIGHVEKAALEATGIIDDCGFYDTEEEARYVAEEMLRHHPHLELFIWDSDNR